MKRTLFFLALFPLMLQGQVQNSKLSENLLLEVLSGANALSGDSIKGGTPTSGVTYQMGNIGGSSDFSASGAATTANGVTFKADGDAPGAWDGAILRPIHAKALTSPDPAYTMTNSGAIPTYGHKGNNSYFEFDGVDDYIQLPVNTAFAFWDNDFSVLFKVKIKSYAANNITVCGGQTNALSMYITTGGKINIDKINVATVSSVSTTTLLEGNEYWIGYIRSGTTGTYYVNGQPDGTCTDNNSYSEYIEFIGKYPVTLFFNGNISSAQIFNYALSADSVAFYSDKSNHLKASDHDGSGNECVLNLTPEGMISQSTWRDYYHSIDVAVGTGATSPRLVKSWAGMNAWRFNGTSSALIKTGLGMTQAMGSTDKTMCVWINKGDNHNENMHIINIGSTGSNEAFYLKITTNKISVGNNTTDASPSGSTTLSLDTWYHVVITFSGGVVKYYLNGVLDGTATISSTNVVTGGIWIGQFNNSTNFNWTGIIEDARVYYDCWSAEKVALDYAVYQN